MLKSFVRKMVGNDHWEYLSWNRSQFGFLAAIRNYVGLLANGGVGRAPNQWTKGSVFLRPGTTDQDVYDEIFIEKEYDIELGDPQFTLMRAHTSASHRCFSRAAIQMPPSSPSSPNPRTSPFCS